MPLVSQAYYRSVQPVSSQRTFIKNSKSDYRSKGCPLCCIPKESFHCQNCVRYGNFVHSSSTSRYIQRFSTKKLKCLDWKQKKSKLEKLCEEKLMKTIQLNKLVSEVMITKERIELLRSFIQEKKGTLLKFKEYSKCLTESNLKRESRLPRYEERIKNLKGCIKVKYSERKMQEEYLIKAEEQLKTVIRISIKQLIDYIFPISLIKHCHSDNSDTVNALAEATKTAYICGKWVTTDTSSEHCIVAPTLPSSGDYYSYDWVSANKDNDAAEHNIRAALTYTAQLVNILAFYLDVILPFKLNYSEFCIYESNNENFYRNVTRLNWNIVNLCLSQNVKAEMINPKTTLQNILYLLNPDISDLGRIGACNVKLDDSKGLEDALRPEFYTDSDDYNHLPCEWELVPDVSIPEISAGAVIHNVESQQQISTSNITEDLMTSASSSIAYFLSGFFNKKC